MEIGVNMVFENQCLCHIALYLKAMQQALGFFSERNAALKAATRLSFQILVIGIYRQKKRLE